VSKILSQLNDVQRLAVEQIDGSQMVIAGAGSGKTRVLTYKIAYMIERGIDPFHILALTFTNKAAREMRERIYKIIDSSEARNVWMGTFHSVFSRILRAEGEKIGYPSNFTIYDSDDSKRLIKSIVKEMNLDDKIYATNIVANRISSAKSSLLTAGQYNALPEVINADRQAKRPEIGNIYKTYAARCFKSSAMDFDDLLLNTYLLFKNYPKVLSKYQEKFKYILVDEYQDTNHAQYIILRSLADRYQNLTVVGDDAQSIYAFRGANIQNILNFNRDYPDSNTVKLEQNYRSTKIIVGAANSLIKNNKGQIPKQIWTNNDKGDLIQVIQASSDNEEGKWVAQSIFDNKIHHHYKNRHFAILYRTNAQSRSMEEALRKLGIPYRIYGGISFYGRKEIKDILAYFRLTINPKDEEAFKRVINYPKRGIGATSIQKLIVAAAENNVSLWEAAGKDREFNIAINNTTLAKIEDFRTMIESFAAQMPKLDAFELANLIIKQTGIQADLNKDKTIEGIGRVENIEELLNAIREFTDKVKEEKKEEIDEAKTSDRLDSFMKDVALMTDADKQEDGDSDKVSLMTVHAAKGLEFPVVYSVGLEENLFPSFMSLNSRSEIEEERRLFYVALTRAMQKAYITYADMRYKWGELKITEPSRFIDEIDEKYLEFINRPSLGRQARKTSMNTSGKFSFDKRKQEKEYTSYSKPRRSGSHVYAGSKKLKKLSEDNSIFKQDSSSTQLRIGMRVKHARFGTGKVISLEGEGQNAKAKIQFPAVGTKTLLLRFAKLEILS
jgi:DNA helicase-2/ATP-dependent DNA helicase PcrA